MATYPIKMLRDEDRQPFVPFTNAAAVVDKDNESLQELMDNGKYKIINNVTTSSAGKGVLDAYQGKVLNDKFNKYVPLTQKGVANGVATLDGEGKVPSSQLPSYVDDVIESYIVSGSTALSAGWLSATNGGAALTPEKGKIYLVMTAGSYQNKQYRWGGSTYVLCNPSDVNSVNGMTGVVTLKKLTIQKNGTQVGDTFNGTTDEVINITVPTNNNQLTNGAGYITSAGSITGNAATATKLHAGRCINTILFDGSIDIVIPYLQSLDKRNSYKPSDMKSKYLTSTFASTGAFDGTANNNHWVDVLGLSGWGDRGGGDVNALVFTKSDSQAIYHYKGAFGATTWASKKQIAYTDSDITGNAATANKVNHTLTIQKNGVKVGDSFDGSAAKTINIVVPTKTSDLTNDNGFGTITEIKVNNTSVGTTGSVNINVPIVDSALSSTSINPLQNKVISPYLTAIKSDFNNGNLDALNDYLKVGYGWSISNAPNGDNAAGYFLSVARQEASTYKLQFFAPHASDTLYMRQESQGTWKDWVQLITEKTYASTTTAGVIKLGTGLAIKDGIVSVTGSATTDSVEWAAVKNAPTKVSYWTNDSGYITLGNVMAGATASTAGKAGVVPAPATGSQAKFLRGDGQWADVSYATSAGKATNDGDNNSISSTYLKRSGGTMTGTITWTDGGNSASVIAEHNLLAVNGGTDGAYVSYATSSGDNGILRIGTLDDASSTLSLGNKVSGTYKEAIRIRDGQATTANPIISSVTTTTHLAGNQGTAIINSTASGNSYNMLFKMNSANGYWTSGSWGSKYCLFYTVKSNVDAGTNNITKEVILLNESGNSVFPGTVIAPTFQGNATSATKLQTARTINGVAFDGSANITIKDNTKLGAQSAYGFYGMASPAGEDNVWIRTTSPGIIPYQQGSIGAGHSAIGTPTWYFSKSYIDKMYTKEVSILEKVNLVYNTTDNCLEFNFS